MRLLRLLVRLLPRGFRREYGADLLETARIHWEARRGELGPWGRLRFWVRQGWAVVRAAATLRSARSGGGTEVVVSGGGRRRSGAERRRERLVDGIWNDVRQSVRALAARPAFAAVAVLTLALGIGATTAMFSAVNSVLLRPLPYDAADRVVALQQVDRRDGGFAEGVSAANVRDLAESSETLEVAAVADPRSHDLMEDGRAISLRSWAVSEGFFEAIGGRPLLGRLFLPEEYQPNAAPVVLLSHATWQSRFGGDPSIVGSTIRLDNAAQTVVGVLPPRFKFPDAAEIWSPRQVQPWDGRDRAASYMPGVARLAPGATLTEAQAEASRIYASLAEQFPRTNANVAIRMTPLREHLFGNVRSPLLLLFGAVALVLLIAAANVAGLQLARGASRGREYALRGALGASRGRLVRLVLVDSLLIAGAGCALGVGLAYGGVVAMRHLAPDQLPRIEELAMDWPVLAFALAATALAAVGSGIVPALGATRVDLQTTLSDGGRGTTGGRRVGRLRDRLVVGEIALALVLSIGAGLLIRSYVAVRQQELGFDVDGRLAVQVFAYDDRGNAKQGFQDRSIEAIRAVPGVEEVALTTDVPSADDETIASIDINVPFTVDNRVAPPERQEPNVAISAISGEYPDVMGIEVTRGRSFSTADHAESPPVVMINEALARRYFPDRDPIGERITVRYPPVASREIVGVLADVRPRGYESEPQPEAYYPISQVPEASLTFVVKGAGDPAALLRPVQDAIWGVDPTQAIWAARTMPDLLRDWHRQRTFNTAVLTAFALLALALAGIGVYGLMSFSVAQRVPEVGVRRAMGAATVHIFRAVMVRGALLGVTGVAIGLVGAVGLSRLMTSMLFATEPLDSVVFAGLSAAVLSVALLAAFLPAWRAARVDPAVALRSE